MARRENHNSDCGNQQLKLYQRYGQNNTAKKFSQNVWACTEVKLVLRVPRNIHQCPQTKFSL